MEKDLRNYLGDLIYLIQDKYNEALSREETDELQKQFDNGMNIAYYDVLCLIESQLIAFGHEVEDFPKIVPVLGKKFTR